MKLCSVPATVGPLCGLYFLGYNAPVDYLLQKQNEDVRNFCAVVVTVGPFFFSLISSALKVKFRLAYVGQVEIIHEVSKYICILQSACL